MGLGSVHVEALDLNGEAVFQFDAPFEVGITARQLLEAAFVGLQLSDPPDPFVFTLEYFGYSTSPEFPGYLGYEVESIGRPHQPPLADAGHYWELLIDGQASQAGADTLRPQPGARVIWQLTSIANGVAANSPRALRVQTRRGKPA